MGQMEKRAMGQVIRPLEQLEGRTYDEPLIFLAGPIKGGGGWQEEAIIILQKLESRLHIASPRSLKPWDPNFTADKFTAQADWESKYLLRAAENGCILFFLPPEVRVEHKPDRAYAQTTRVELGLWLSTRASVEAPDSPFRAAEIPNIVIGFGDAGKDWEKFYMSRRISGERYFRYTIARTGISYAGQTPICEGLESTCQEAVRICPKPIAWSSTR